MSDIASNQTIRTRAFLPLVVAPGASDSPVRITRVGIGSVVTYPLGKMSLAQALAAADCTLPTRLQWMLGCYDFRDNNLLRQVGLGNAWDRAVRAAYAGGWRPGRTLVDSRPRHWQQYLERDEDG